VGDGFSLTHPKFFAAMDAMLVDVPAAQWHAYLRFHAIDDAAPYLSTPFQMEDFAFNQQTLNGQKEIKARWKRSLALLAEQTLRLESPPQRLEPQECLARAGRPDIVTAEVVAPALQIHLDESVHDDPRALARHQGDTRGLGREDDASHLRRVVAQGEVHVARG